MERLAHGHGRPAAGPEARAHGPGPGQAGGEGPRAPFNLRNAMMIVLVGKSSKHKSTWICQTYNFEIAEVK